MSDFYDSLEDEGNDDKISSGFLDHFRSDLSDKSISSQSDSDADDSNGQKNFTIDLSREKTKIFCNSQTGRNLKKVTRSEDNFLPIIERRREIRDSKNEHSYVSFDNELLCKQGLQINRDGGITKSPRTDVEELPFVTREYRSSIFQNKKPFEVKKRAPAAKINRKNTFTFKENSTNEISMVAIINARGKKGSSEEILTSGGSRCSSKESSTKINKDFDNLTDSMKEMILRKQSESTFSKKSEEEVEGEEKKSSKVAKKPEGKTKPQKVKILSRRSDFDLKLGKTNLSYMERRQKEKGFNPLSLRLESKKSPSETTRSNFGDPLTDRLSDVSSGVPNISYAEAEDEARFYEKIIQMEKNMTKNMSKSSRSATPVEDKKIKIIDGFHSCKERREAKSLEKSRLKSVGKSTSIDLPLEDNKKRICKKNFHYCKIDACKDISKTELALRARAYGSMANARNIFKLKTQSENKINSVELQKEKPSSKSKMDVEKGGSGTLKREKSKQENVFAKTSKSLNKTNGLTAEGDFSQKFVFPPLSCLNESDKNLKSEVLRQIGSCLDGTYIDCSYVSLPNLVNEFHKSETHN